MRVKRLMRALPALALVLTVTPSTGQPARDFNACALFTAEDATAVLGAPAEPEATKGKPPKVQPNCVYTATADGKPVLLSVQFRFFRSPAEAVAAVKEARLEARGRPFIIGGQDAYWHPKQAHLVITKGQAVVTITAGPLRESERVPEPARKAADVLLPKLG
ncbi:MAG: hypothetical protein JNM76_02805 [Betaproteobacteria bacterium]|nr:hypothetical protein [Betaproteobacteria bacterium]